MVKAEPMVKAEVILEPPSTEDDGPKPRDSCSKKTEEYWTKVDEGDGKIKRKCKFCDLVIIRNVTRMRHHLTGLRPTSTNELKQKESQVRPCPNVPRHVKESLIKMEAGKERVHGITGEHYRVAQTIRNEEVDRKVESEGFQTPSAAGIDGGANLRRGSNEFRLSQSSASASRAGKFFSTPSSSRQSSGDATAALNVGSFQKGDIRYWSQVDKMRSVDKKWARAVYEMGLPFNTFAHPAFKEAFAHSLGLHRYTLPGPKKLSNELLDEEYAEFSKLKEKEMFPQSNTKMTISCDGWTNIQGRPLMNIMLSNKYGEYFVDAIDGSNELKDAKWQAEHLLEVIRKRGPENVLQFVADGASVNVKTGMLIREEYPHIIFGRCVAHGLDLLCEDIGKFDWVQVIFDECRDIVTYIKGHRVTHMLFTDKFSNGLTLLKPSLTRFMTNFIMIDRAYALRWCLKKMTVSAEWHEHEAGVSDTQKKLQVKKVRRTIQDLGFWDKMHDLLWLLYPIFDLLQRVDEHRHFIGDIYWESWNLQEAMRKMHMFCVQELKAQLLTAHRCDQVALLLHNRWNKWCNPLHVVAMLLTPKYLLRHAELHYLQSNHVKMEFFRYYNLYAKHVKKLDDGQRKVWVKGAVRQLATILSRSDPNFSTDFCREMAEENRDQPEIWWATFGQLTPHLCELVGAILGQCVTSSCCERNWSAFANVHSKKRNKLQPERVKKLVFVHFNKNISTIQSKLIRKSAKATNKYFRSRGQQQYIRHTFRGEYPKEMFGVDFNAWLDKQYDDFEENAREQAADEIRKPSNKRTKTVAIATACDRENIYDDDLDDVDFFSDGEGGNDTRDVEDEDDIVMTQRTRYVTGHDDDIRDRRVTADEVEDEDTLDISLPKLILNEPHNIPSDGKLRD